MSIMEFITDKYVPFYLVCLRYLRFQNKPEMCTVARQGDLRQGYHPHCLPPSIPDYTLVYQVLLSGRFPDLKSFVIVNLNI